MHLTIVLCASASTCINHSKECAQVQKKNLVKWYRPKCGGIRIIKRKRHHCRGKKFSSLKWTCYLKMKFSNARKVIWRLSIAVRIWLSIARWCLTAISVLRIVSHCAGRAQATACVRSEICTLFWSITSSSRGLIRGVSGNFWSECLFFFLGEFFLFRFCFWP